MLAGGNATWSRSRLGFHLLTERGGNTDQAGIARALDDLLTRAETGPLPADRTTRRVAARTRAAAATPLRPTPDPAEELDDLSPPQDDRIDESGELDSDATVIPFGVFNAREEAERFW